MKKHITYKLKPIHFCCSLILFSLLIYVIGLYEVQKDEDIKGLEYDLQILDENSFKKGVLKGKVTVLFYQDESKVYKKMEHYMKIVASNNRSDLFFKVKITSHSPLAEAYNLSGTPVILFFNEGKPAGRIMGYVPLSNFEMIYKRIK